MLVNNYETTFVTTVRELLWEKSTTVVTGWSSRSLSNPNQYIMMILWNNNSSHLQLSILSVNGSWKTNWLQKKSRLPKQNEIRNHCLIQWYILENSICKKIQSITGKVFKHVNLLRYKINISNVTPDIWIYVCVDFILCFVLWKIFIFFSEISEILYQWFF